MFEDIVIYGGETRTDVADAQTDPDFPTYAELISDGLDWWLYEIAYFDGGPSLVGQFDLESVRLEFTDPDHSGPDLQGYEIESVVRTITVELDSPGSDPNGDGNWTDFSITGVFEIYGHAVPEPAMLAPLLLMATIITRRFRG